MTEAPPLPEIDVVIPALNAAGHLPQVLQSLRDNRGHKRILVVDAGSEDQTANLARELGTEVLELTDRAGPALARNHGAALATAELILFLDADCVPGSSVCADVKCAFAEAPDLIALCGSYDADPPAPGFFSQYMNLRHHFTHQHASVDPTFWAGCGAVRRKAFESVGGFDAERYPLPQIEDIELGLRLRALGTLRLDPQLQVKHLKSWSLGSVIETDIFHRALPWSRLILERGEMPTDLNLRVSQRSAAVLAGPALLSLPCGAVAAALGAPIVLLSCLSLVLTSMLLNWPMLSLFRRKRGWLFALGGWFFHQGAPSLQRGRLRLLLAIRRDRQAQCAAEEQIP